MPANILHQSSALGTARRIKSATAKLKRKRDNRERLRRVTIAAARFLMLRDRADYS